MWVQLLLLLFFAVDILKTQLFFVYILLRLTQNQNKTRQSRNELNAWCIFSVWVDSWQRCTNHLCIPFVNLETRKISFVSPWFEYSFCLYATMCVSTYYVYIDRRMSVDSNMKKKNPWICCLFIPQIFVHVHSIFYSSIPLSTVLCTLKCAKRKNMSIP